MPPPSKGKAPRSSSKATPAKRASSSTSSKKPAKPRAPKGGGSPRSRKGSAGSSGGQGPLTFAWWRTEAVVWVSGILVGLALAGGLLFVDARREVRAWLAEPPRATPTTVWSAPIRVRTGQVYALADLVSDLIASGYEQARVLDGPGRFVVGEGQVDVWTEALKGPGFSVPSGKSTVEVREGRVSRTSPTDGVVLRPSLLATLGDLEARRTPVTLADVSPHMAPALLAIEDARFRDHVGVDPVGILRALFHNLRGGDLHGGSTLTQQLAKNLFLHQERTVRRKVREVFFSAALEAELDKDALLELYLSEVYLGHVDGVPVHGVEQAARTWFGKSAARLTASEAATIAGVIASPNTWSPMRSPDRALVRRNQVLQRMVAVRALTEAQADEALAEPLSTLASPPSRRWRAPWMVDAALEAAVERLGEGFTAGTGARLWTTTQPHLQRAAQQAVVDGLTHLAEEHPDTQGAEGALAMIDVATGDVLALVGGHDFIESPFHRALHARRAAGSTIKPLLLLEALRRDPALTLSTPFDDAPIARTLDGRTWRPGNHDGTFLGPLTLRRAIELSRNIPAISLSERIGLPEVQRVLRNAGLQEATSLPSVALGAFPANVVQLAGAYSAFPGQGVVRVPRVLLGVSDDDGRELLVTGVDQRTIADATSAALATRVLAGVLTDGTGRGVSAFGLSGALAGKTGTSDEGRDAWFVGFDPETVTAVWVGKDRDDLGQGGSVAALPVWARFAVSAGMPRGRFAVPPDLTQEDVCADSGQPPCEPCEVRREWFRKGTVPDAPCGMARHRRAERAIDRAEETP